MKELKITFSESSGITVALNGLKNFEALGLLTFALRTIEAKMTSCATEQDKPKTKITIDDFIQSKPTMSVRLINILTSKEKVYNDDYEVIGLENIFKTLDDVSKHRFLMVRNAGLKSWHEFVDLIKN